MNFSPTAGILVDFSLTRIITMEGSKPFKVCVYKVRGVIAEGVKVTFSYKINHKAS